MSPSILPATDEGIRRAAARLRDGRLVAFPTETVYGLGADARNAGAVRAIFAAKRRPADHPVIVHVRGVEDLDDWASSPTADARRLCEAFWPGPLTVIVPRAPDVPDAVTGGQPTVGVRAPSHPVARALLDAFASLGGSGIAAPSANRFGHVSATLARHVAEDLRDSDVAIVDGGECPLGIESTIVAFAGGEPMLLRPGAIDVHAIARVLGRMPRGSDATAPRASGTLPSHYAPRTLARLVAPASLHAEVGQHASRDETCAVLARAVPRPGDFDGTWIALPHDPAGYAHALYATLRDLDAAGADAILIEAPPDEPAWDAVRDRLSRATSRDARDEP